jgi:hypothetical protein
MYTYYINIFIPSQTVMGWQKAHNSYQFSLKNSIYKQPFITLFIFISHAAILSLIRKFVGILKSKSNIYNYNSHRKRFDDTSICLYVFWNLQSRMPELWWHSRWNGLDLIREFGSGRVEKTEQEWFKLITF